MKQYSAMLITNTLNVNVYWPMNDWLMREDDFRQVFKNMFYTFLHAVYHYMHAKIYLI